MTGNERLLRRMSVGDILDYSIELYKRNFKQLMLLALILYIPFILVYTAVSSYMTGDIMRVAGADIMMEAAPDASEGTYRFLAQMALLGVLGLLYIAFAITLQPVLDASVSLVIYRDAVNGRLISWKEATRNSFNKFGKLFLNRLLYGLILYGISTAAVLILYLGIFLVALFAVTSFTTGSAVNGIGEVVAAVAVIGLSLIFLAGIGLFVGYFALRFGLGTQSVVIENTPASKAITRSHELTAKNFWRSGFAAGTALLMTTLLPTVLATGAYALLFVDKNLYTLGNMAAQIIAGLFQPFFTVVLTVVFIDLKVRKEGLDLEVKVDALLEEEKRKAELAVGSELINA